MEESGIYILKLFIFKTGVERAQIYVFNLQYETLVRVVCQGTCP